MSVKERVFESRKIEMYRMRVYFVGKAVPDRMPLASLGLGKNDVLQVIKINTSGKKLVYCNLRSGEVLTCFKSGLYS